MKKLYKLYSLFTLFIIFGAFSSCVKNDDFEIPEEHCSDDIIPNKTIKEIFDTATGIASKYIEEDFIEGYVISSDQKGNFFKTISIQAFDGSIGFNIPIDQTELYTIYNPGRKVYIKLKGTYVEIDNDALQIGDLFIDNFNNQTAGRISYPAYEEVIIKSCQSVNENELVNNISINDISDDNLNTLVEINNVQFEDNALGTTFYDSSNDLGGSATNHLIQNSSGVSLIVRTSAFADFANLEVPDGSGTIRGVLTKFNNDYQLIPRALTDIKLSNDRFDIVVKNNIFITEIADPNNNTGARFIEIYNAEDEPINLNGWTIRRYTNNSTSVSSTLNLSGNIINIGQAFVIAANAAEFEAVFGFIPDMEGGTNGPADSNGDDNLELVDPFGNVVDIFGVIGEDGTGTNHEFEDGRALRNLSILTGNPIYTFSEWQLWNDTGDAGTINEPQDAPGNFTPGIR